MRGVALCVLLVVVMGTTTAVTPRSADDLVMSVLSECTGSETCVKHKLLEYLDGVLGLTPSSARSFPEDKSIDKAIFKRVARVVKTHEFKATLPGGVEMIYNPRSGFDLGFPEGSEEDESASQARGILKKKLLLPVLLLLKLKLKALMPIFVALIGLKSLKALILSKLAITLVVGFLVYTLFLKGGMPMPMMMMMTTEAPPMPMPPSNSYGSPVTPGTPISSYEPGWEPSGSGSSSSGGPYSRIWSSSSSDLSPLSSSSSSSGSHNLVYSAYYPSSATSTHSPTY